MKVVGIKRKQGEYQGIQYDNFMIYCTCKDNSCIAGVVTDVIKVKAFDVSEVFEEELVKRDLDCPDNDFWASLVGSSIRVSYDKYGKCSCVGVIDTDKK